LIGSGVASVRRSVVAVLHVDLARDRALPCAHVIQDHRDRVRIDGQFCHLSARRAPGIMNAKIIEADGIPCTSQPSSRRMGIDWPVAPSRFCGFVTF